MKVRGVVLALGLGAASSGPPAAWAEDIPVTLAEALADALRLPDGAKLERPLSLIGILPGHWA